MAKIRFKPYIGPSKNQLIVEETLEVINLLSRNEPIFVSLQVGTVEQGNDYYGEHIENAVLIADIYPDGEYNSRLETMSCQVRDTLGIFHTVYIPIDKDNRLVGHVTQSDSKEFSLDTSDKIAIPMQLDHVSNSKYSATFLAPRGEIVDGVVITQIV